MRPPDPWPTPPETAERQALREHREELNRKLRATFLAGAEEQMLRDHGRGLTDDELREVLVEYPGDLRTR